MPSLADALSKQGFVNAENSAPSLWLDTGYPVLNKRISGSYFKGFPMGRMVEIFGPPSAGKTAIAQSAMKAAQDAGGVAIFFDHETSFDLRLAEKLGLDPDPNKFIYLQPDTFEESMDSFIKIVGTIREGNFGIDKDAPIVVIWDSLAAMIPQSKWDKDASDFNMNDNTALARATAAAFPTLSKRITKWNVCGIFLNQARTKIGVMFGDPTSTPGGSSMEFYASVRLKLGGGKLKDGAGKTIGCETVKNKIYRPFQKCKWDFVFQDDGTGKFDVVGGVIDELKELKLLPVSGAYIEWDGKKYYKAGLTKLIESDPAQKQKLFDMLPDNLPAPQVTIEEEDD
tara:strand:- start:1658 stop:2680 length:1023 start_codon:yes stop_codon:yes gene_type:complete